MLVYAWMLSLQSRLKEDRGATAVEYGLLVGLIAVAIIAGLLIIGPKLTAIFNNVGSNLPTVK